MKTFDAIGLNGELHSFEVENSRLSRRQAVEIVASVPGVEILRASRSWLFGRDDFCEFRLGGKTFEIWEPFGDNSRFMIVGDPPGPSPELLIVKEAFASASVTLLGRLRHAV